MNFAGMNILAIGLAVVAGFAFGAVYYMSLSRQWLAAIGKTKEEISGKRSIAPFITSFVALVVMAWVLAGTLGHICQQRGYQLADITLLQPIGFLSLIWNTMLGYFLFFQKPDVWTFVGAAVIFGSALYISHREAVRRAQIKTAGSQANPEA